MKFSLVRIKYHLNSYFQQNKTLEIEADVWVGASNHCGAAAVMKTPTRGASLWYLHLQVGKNISHFPHKMTRWPAHFQQIQIQPRTSDRVVEEWVCFITSRTRVVWLQRALWKVSESVFTWRERSRRARNRSRFLFRVAVGLLAPDHISFAFLFLTAPLCHKLYEHCRNFHSETDTFGGTIFYCQIASVSCCELNLGWILGLAARTCRRITKTAV